MRKKKIIPFFKKRNITAKYIIPGVSTHLLTKALLSEEKCTVFRAIISF